MFDKTRADRVCNFFEKVLRHPSAGNTPFILLEWERLWLRRIFGNVNAQGFRTIQTVYTEVGKKNGKSELAAGVALYLLTEDDEPACEIYGAATVKKQAGIVFNTARAMVRASPQLRKILKVIPSSKRIVKRDDPSSFYAVIAADGDAEDGINPHGVIIDELHRWKTKKALELYEVLTKGNIARRQPLIVEITTAGASEEESPLCYREHQKAIMVQNGEHVEPQYYGKIFTIDPGDDWTDPSCYWKANPSIDTLGGFLKIEKLIAERDEALAQPSRQPAFKRFRLGLWMTLESRWMDPEIWARNAAPLRALIGRPCYLGLDLSRTTDLTSLVLLFPDRDGTFDVLPFFWMAREQVRKRELADRAPYSTWIQQKRIEATNGEVIDLKDIKKKIKWAAELFSIQEVGYDPKDASQLAIELYDEVGLTCVPIYQTFSHLSAPMKRIEEWATMGKIRHADHPVLKWNMRVVKAKSDGEDNIKPVKPDRATSGDRIDGAVALILAASRAMFHKPSLYDSQGVMVL